ncbi:hypothetical protein [Pseudomonas sp. SBT1-2]|uniref:hypothetical protein n=1 Tax=Pseudomonas sp. SBT1-2 TaxID=3027852 RepID=UPI002360BB27|nr:hypothetical protein [Pseudomonas sp. SBT1-2]
MYGRFFTLFIGVLLGGLSCQGTPPTAPTPSVEPPPEIATPPKTALRAEPAPVAQRPRDGLGSSYSTPNDHSHTLLSF